MSAVLGLFYIFYKTILQKETYFKQIRYFFLLGALLSVAIPFIVIPIVQIQEAVTTVASFSTTNSFSSTRDITASNIDWFGYLSYIYLMVSGFFVLKFLVQLIAIFNLILKSNIEKQDGYYIIKTEKATSPFSFFNFIVYNPLHFNDTELAQILAHEKVHAKEGHSFDSILINLIVAIQWFNPLVWFFKNELEQNLEFIADENAVKKSINKKSYQQLLLKTTVPDYQMALANNFYNSLLKNRIIMLHKKKSNSNGQWKLTLMVPLLLVFIFTFNTKVIAQEKDKEVKKIEKKVEIIAIGFSKETPQDKLDKIVKDFAEKGLDVKFSGIKRNKDNHITAIEVSAKAKSGKASSSFGSNLKDGIHPITIRFDQENNDLSIGSGKERSMHRYAYKTKGSKKRMKSKGKGGTFIFKSNSDTDDEDVNIWINKDGDTTKIMKREIEIEENDGNENEDMEEIIIEENEGSGKKIIKEIVRVKGKKGNKQIMISTDEDDDPNVITTYIVNGKKMTKAEFKKMDPDKIKTIEIKKETKKKD